MFTPLPVVALRRFTREFPVEECLARPPRQGLSQLLDAPETFEFVSRLVELPAFEEDLDDSFAAMDAVRALPAARKLRSALSQPVQIFCQWVAELASVFDVVAGARWSQLAERVGADPIGAGRLLDLLELGAQAEDYRALRQRLEQENPHALFPTSPYRESGGSVVSAEDGQVIEAVMTSRTFTSIRIEENVLHPENTLLRDLYRPLERCVGLLDENVEEHYGTQIASYFAHHGIRFEKLVHRAMEVDKAIHSVERILGEFKALGVSRNEPVLIAGGGVLADVGGLACGLYHRNTPYVMLGTSIVSGIDAGPSPRTCCDGFGYKNLFGAYHAPVLTILDRSFFRTLREGWLRHGVAEIIKMAVVKDARLFEALETAGPDLVRTRFSTAPGSPGSEIDALSREVLSRAMRSYVEAEYGNLYETHQCRPHAYGHTWSPGFEIEAGLLHGHAVAIGMGFGAFLSHRADWIDRPTLDRILGLIGRFELSLWHDVLDKPDTLWSAQQKMVEKRGGNLAAPLPRGGIGSCGYLNRLSRDELLEAARDYAALCRELPRGGIGVEPLCRDVGLEDPSTVFAPETGRGCDDGR